MLHTLYYAICAASMTWSGHQTLPRNPAIFIFSLFSSNGMYRCIFIFHFGRYLSSSTSRVTTFVKQVHIVQVFILLKFKHAWNFLFYTAWVSIFSSTQFWPFVLYLIIYTRILICRMIRNSCNDNFIVQIFKIE